MTSPAALFREKIVAQASAREVIVVDDSKLSDRQRFQIALRYLWRSAAVVRANKDGSQYVTDSGNMIMDCNSGPIADVNQLLQELGARAGIIEHGLFIGIATDVIVTGEGGVRYLQRPSEGGAPKWQS